MATPLDDLITKMALTKEEEEAVEGGDNHLKPAEDKSWLCLVGTVLAMRPFNLEALRTTMESVWNPSKGMRTKVIKKNLFLFQFNHIIDKRRVLQNGPWSFDKNIILLKEVTDSWQPSQIAFSTAVFWVQVYDLPLISMTCAVGQILGNRLGKFVDMDFVEGGVAWGQVLRIRAEIDITKPLHRGMKVAFQDRDPVWVTFKYERLPNFCYFCSRLGHGDRECPARMLGDAGAEGHGDQYGAWPRAGPFHMHAKLMKGNGGSTATAPSVKHSGGSLVSPVMGMTAPRSTMVEAPAEAEFERSSGDGLGDFHAEVREDISPNMDIVIPPDLLLFKIHSTREIGVENGAREGGKLGEVVHGMGGPGEVAHHPVTPDCSVLGLSGGSVQEKSDPTRHGPTLLMGQVGLRVDRPAQAIFQATGSGNTGAKKWKKMARTLAPVSLSPVMHGGEKRQREESAKVFHMVGASSDHAPILVDVLGQRDRQRFKGGRSRLYRFEAMWLRDSRCEANISAWWSRSSSDTVEALRSSIDGLGSRLMRWSKSVFGEIPKLIRDKEKDLQRLANLSHMTASEISKTAVLRRDISELFEREEIFWFQRARANWIKEGDRNTSFFHAKASQRQSKKRIDGLENSNGVWCSEPAQLEQIVVEYFEQLFTASQAREMATVLNSIDSRFWFSISISVLVPQFRFHTVGFTR
ncbi:Uncharacterized protein LOK49_LG05G01337 [Camellia lanceoleosa]|uniref:Uncharacterized protein n=1 Tax=Camellia lanceoleosa TaxID=1840588 RepID=A0ACC0HSF1_9ERIC|nr:Uncharacterized protein LOK49_LG05G01337 [Camellia lanceoleosa]